jgi:hypothetical protein
MSNVTEICIELKGKWVQWAAFNTDELGEEHTLGDDVLHYHEVPGNTVEDMARVVGVLEVIQLGLEYGIPEHFTIDVTNGNPAIRGGDDLTAEREASAMLADNGLEMPEA